MKTKKQTYNFGILAEKIAISFLRLKGYEILEWRFKTKVGEVDIIAKKSDVIIAVEVKARSKKGKLISKKILMMFQNPHPPHLNKIKAHCRIMIFRILRNK